MRCPLLLLIPALLAAEDLTVTIGRHRLHLTCDDVQARAAQECLTLWQPGSPRRADRRHLLTRTVAFAPLAEPQAVARAGGLGIARPGLVAGVWLAEAPAPRAALDAAEVLVDGGWVRWAEPQIGRPRHHRTLPNDPQLGNQWHLINDGTLVTGAVSGMDLHVVPAWDAGYHGNGRLIAIIDGAFAQHHSDLTAVLRSDLALNIWTGGSDPWTTDTTDLHATLCAGLAAARGNNGLGTTGVAWEAQVVPIKLLTKPDSSLDDAQEATALGHDLTLLDVSSNSWGPSDNGRVTSGPGNQTLATLADATASGRGGKGTVIVWAAGNGRSNEDNLAYDGYASDRHVLAIGGIDIDGTQAWYSESGPATFAVAPGGGDRAGMVSTLPADTYATIHDGEVGTSFATPGAAGVAALVIEAAPSLTWREVRHVLATTARQINPADSLWQTGGGGLPWHPGYGFGLLDAGAAVTAATTATPLPPEADPLLGTWTGSLGLPDGVSASGPAAQVDFTISGASDYRCEWVECTLDAVHPYQGDLDVLITAPSGRTARVDPRPPDSNPAGHWTYTAVGFLGQDPNGTWSVAVRDRSPRDTGRITGISLVIRGYRTGGATTSGQATVATGTGTSPAGSGIAPASPSSSSTSSSGCGQGGIFGMILALLAWAGYPRKLLRRRSS